MHLCQLLLGMGHKGDEQVGRALAILRQGYAELLGVMADAADHDRREVLRQSEHAGAQPVAEARQRAMLEVAPLGDGARLPVDLGGARRRGSCGDDDVARGRLRRTLGRRRHRQQGGDKACGGTGAKWHRSGDRRARKAKSYSAPAPWPVALAMVAMRALRLMLGMPS